MDYNDHPYTGRQSDSHKPKKAKKPKQVKAKSGGATFGQTVVAVGLFLALPAGVVGGVAAYLLHGYGVI